MLARIDAALAELGSPVDGREAHHHLNVEAGGHETPRLVTRSLALPALALDCALLRRLPMT